MPSNVLPGGHATPHPSLVRLIARLQQTDIDCDAETLADMLWLARHMRPVDPGDATDTDIAEDREAVQENPAPQSAEPSVVQPSPPQAFDVRMPPSSTPQSASSTASSGGIPFQTPTAPALRATLSLGRALRPLMRKVNAYGYRVLDEDATAEQTAECRLCTTVMKPARERWLEVTLVVEKTALSHLWADTIDDFQHLLERQGAFRRVSVWYLDASSDTPQLFAKWPESSPALQPRSAKELIDSAGRRLILLVSDCISPAWKQSSLYETYLNCWSKQGLLALVHLLPGRLWERSIVSEGVPVQFSALEPGTPNQQLRVNVPLDEEPPQAPGLKLPVITLEPTSLTQWSKMIGGYGDAWATGVWFDAPYPQGAEYPLSPPFEESAAQIVKRFYLTASQLAKRLAEYMATGPVSLPVIYLIQQTKLPESTPLHIAEVFMSGLVIRQDSELIDAKGSYDFVPGVREQLVDRLPKSETEALLDAISEYIGAKLGLPIYSFMALLRLEQDQPGTVGEDVLTFARITKQVLRRLGSDYAALVDSISPTLIPFNPDESETSAFPPLADFEFKEGAYGDEDTLASFPPPTESYPFTILTLEPGPDATPSLETFEITIATLTGRGKQWQVQRQSQTARRYVEPLSEGINLEMVAIPDGQFVMGSPVNEPERSDSEGPQHQVTINPFFMGRYPITQAQWRAWRPCLK